MQIKQARYFSTCVSGAQAVVSNALKSELGNVSITEMLDGMLVYKYRGCVEDIRKLRFFNNSFYLIKKFPTPKDKCLRHFLKVSGSVDVSRHAIERNKSFRVIFSVNNRLVKINRKTLALIEANFAHATGLKVDRSCPDVEVWFLSRSEGYTFLGIRLTKRRASEKKLHRGELKPEMANLLCQVADIQGKDVVFDPFSGYGSIPGEIDGHFNCRRIFAGERNLEMRKIFVNRFRGRKRVLLLSGDSLGNNIVKPGSVDKIITDPPWGLYTDNDADFVGNMLVFFSKVLKPAGSAVLLMGNKEVFEDTLRSSQDFVLDEKYDILVSGKKAGIYVLDKIS